MSGGDLSLKDDKGSVNQNVLSLFHGEKIMVRPDLAISITEISAFTPIR